MGGGGGQRSFGTFPKIHPIWKRGASLREDIDRKRMFTIGHCPNHLTPPTPIRTTSSSCRTSKTTFCAYDGKIPMMIMIIAMIIMVVILIVIMTRMTKRHTIDWILAKNCHCGDYYLVEKGPTNSGMSSSRTSQIRAMPESKRFPWPWCFQTFKALFELFLFTEFSKKILE